jgi:hypothetical protein
MTEDRFDVLEKFESLFEAPEPSFERFRRDRERRRRNQRVTAGVVAIVVFIVPIALIFGSELRSDRGQMPGDAQPSAYVPEPPGSYANEEVRRQRLSALAQDVVATLDLPTTIDQSFVDGVNDCSRLLVTRDGVERALGFRVDRLTPWEPIGGSLRYTPTQIQRWSGVEFGCNYHSPTAKLGGGQVVISAYTSDSPPRADGRSEPVPGIGDEAWFSLIGNGDGHFHGPEGATSMLQVRLGDLILRFNASIPA